MVDKLKSIWMDGRFVDWDDARVHVLTHSLHYGLGIFEGIRSYRTAADRPAIFRLQDHIRRFFDSAKIVNMTIPHTPQEIESACAECLALNELDEGYIRPLAYLGDGTMGVFPTQNPVRVFIAVWKWGAYLGEGALKNGVRAKVSSFQRFFPNTAMTRAKVTGQYSLGVLAKMEVRALGFDEAILLDTDGYVAEGTGENIFLVRDGRIKTTPLTVVLPGLTRATIMTLARDLAFEVVEQRFTRDEVYAADEVFFTGTAAEVTPIREVDGRTIGSGKPGPVTKRLQETYFATVRGENAKYSSWLTFYDLEAHEPRRRAKAAARR